MTSAGKRYAAYAALALAVANAITAGKHRALIACYWVVVSIYWGLGL